MGRRDRRGTGSRSAGCLIRPTFRPPIGGAGLRDLVRATPPRDGLLERLDLRADRGRHPEPGSEAVEGLQPHPGDVRRPRSRRALTTPAAARRPNAAIVTPPAVSAKMPSVRARTPTASTISSSVTDSSEPPLRRTSSSAKWPSAGAPIASDFAIASGYRTVLLLSSRGGMPRRLQSPAGGGEPRVPRHPSSLRRPRRQELAPRFTGVAEASQGLSLHLSG